MFDYINRVEQMLLLLVYEGTWTHSSPLIDLHLLYRSCVSVGFFLKLHATFPSIMDTRLNIFTKTKQVEFIPVSLCPYQISSLLPFTCTIERYENNNSARVLWTKLEAANNFIEKEENKVI